jgi:hypothetical protein
MTMALLPLLMHRHPCHCQAGVVVLVTMALSPLIRDGVVALVVMALSPSSSWHCCPHCNGIVFIINVITLIARWQAGISAV